MDILHHAAIGVAGAMALAATGEPLASAAFLTASILPDADVAVMARGKRAFLKAHQSATHSLPVAAAVSALLAAIAAWHFGAGPGIAAGMAFFAGLAIHVLLDASNTLGTWLLWPFGRRLRLDAVFFIDALSWSLTGITILTLWLTGQAWPFGAWAAAMSGQIYLRACLARRARSASGYPVAIPDPLVPWVFFLTRIEADGTASTARWSAFASVSDEARTTTPSPTALALVAESEAVADMKGFARALAVVDEKVEAGTHRVVMRDLAMRRLGGRYGEITLTRFANGEVDEQINI